MTITALTHHDDHTVTIHLTKDGSVHYAALRCVECNKHIQWLNRAETKIAMDLNLVTVEPRKTAKDFWNEI